MHALKNILEKDPDLAGPSKVAVTGKVYTKFTRNGKVYMFIYIHTIAMISNKSTYIAST
jgi:hypothetical protein